MNEDTDIQVWLGVEEVYSIKCSLIGKLEQLTAAEKDISDTFHRINGYTPVRLQEQYGTWAQEAREKYIDQACWKYLVSLFHLEKYMLCSDYGRMQDDIEGFRAPVFYVENAEAWLAGLKDLIHDNVRTLVKKVFQEITQGTYRTGSSYNAPRKKRNNNGVDQRFILRTGDWSSLFGYWSRTPSVTDDLEKVCYILAGKSLPEKTAKDVMREENRTEYSNAYFTLKVCQNGNTHYTLSDDIRNKLNLYGPVGAVLGEDIKIKIVERWAS